MASTKTASRLPTKKKSHASPVAQRRQPAEPPQPSLFARSIITNTFRLVIAHVAAWLPTYTDTPRKMLDSVDVYTTGTSVPHTLRGESAMKFMTFAGDLQHLKMMEERPDAGERSES